MKTQRIQIKYNLICPKKLDTPFLQCKESDRFLSKSLCWLQSRYMTLFSNICMLFNDLELVDSFGEYTDHYTASFVKNDVKYELCLDTAVFEDNSVSQWELKEAECNDLKIQDVGNLVDILSKIESYFKVS